MIPRPTAEALLDAVALVEAHRHDDDHGWRIVRRHSGTNTAVIVALATIASYLSEALDQTCECGAEGQHALDVMRAYALDTS